MTSRFPKWESRQLSYQRSWTWTKERNSDKKLGEKNLDRNPFHSISQSKNCLLHCPFVNSFFAFSMHRGLDWSSQPHARVARGNLQETIRILYDSGAWLHNASQLCGDPCCYQHCFLNLGKACQGHSLTSLRIFDGVGLKASKEVTRAGQGNERKLPGTIPHYVFSSMFS